MTYEPFEPGNEAKFEPDYEQLARFIRGIFKHCRSGGDISSRAFYEGEERPFRIRNVPLRPEVFCLDLIIDDARMAANQPEPVVFCPPCIVIAPQRGRGWGQARTQDILEAPVLSVEVDKSPSAALATLEQILGPPLFVVRSGGVWENPDTGQKEDRLHGHWRLTVPAQDPSSIANLYEARRLATTLVGGDHTSINSVHCIRWPGSWHRKAGPRLCKIIVETENEIELDENKIQM